MRILLLHAPHFRAQLGRSHEVLSWGAHAHADVCWREGPIPLPRLLDGLPPAWRAPDAIVVGDDSRPLGVLALETAPCPLVLLSIDAHHHAAWHGLIANAFDTVFVAQRDTLPSFHQSGADHATWMPLWAPDDLPAPADVPRWDAAFVGTLNPRLHPDRLPFLEAVQARAPLLVREGPYADLFADSRIVLNQTVRGDLNGRVFEAMACGAMLLTERVGHGLDDLFVDGTHLVTYPRHDAVAAAERIHHFLAHEPERRRLADAGRELVRDRHCERHRAATVLDAITASRRCRPEGVRRAGLARGYLVLVDWLREYAERAPGIRAATRIAVARYLVEATHLATDPLVEPLDRCVIDALVARANGELARAADGLRTATARSARLEDHLHYVEVLIRLERGAEAHRAVDRLAALRPDLERPLRDAIGPPRTEPALTPAQPGSSTRATT